MAAHAPITGAPTRAPAFKLNGVSLSVDEPYPYLDQAHALSICLTDTVKNDMQINEEILDAALRGITTLIELAALGLHHMDSKREGR